MDFAEFIAPMPVERFLADHFGAKPLHLPAGPQSRRATLDWEWLNRVLAALPQWTPGNLKLVLNTEPVLADHYVDEVQTSDGPSRRANPAKVHMFMGMGASLVANSVEEVSPEVREVTAMLSRTFAGVSVANAYCSFKDVQAFDSHFDLHEVFVVHFEGEKTWRLYRDRVEAPIEQPPDHAAKSIIDRVKGPVMQEVTLRPGDLLYIPRGYIHDALAGSEASLHLTYAVMPYDARLIFRLLEPLAAQQAAFRAYLPDGRLDGGAPLRAAIDALADRVAALMRTPRFEAEVAARQQMQIHSDYRFDLPERPKPEFYARTQRPAAVVSREAGVFLSSAGVETPLGVAGEAAEWMLAQDAFTRLQLEGAYGWMSAAQRDALVGLLARLGLIVPYTPPAAVTPSG
jgi:lysine-specific demethylase/histidyl-hydroxylase NO66